MRARVLQVLRLMTPVVGLLGSMSCGRTPVVVDDAVAAAVEPVCPGPDPDAPDEPPVNPKVDSCDELPLDFPTFGCDPDTGECTSLIVECVPRDDPGTSAFKCCSDDPATYGGLLPDYLDRGIDGRLPIFSGGHNRWSETGACIRTRRISDGLREVDAEGCPVPCNPTWPAEAIEQVCGEQRVCCQTRAVQEEDCIFDPVLGRHRPVRGSDICGWSDWPNCTRWRPDDHATHQDINGSTCLSLAGGEPNEQFQDCVWQLTVADQRGFCAGANDCCTDERYLEACDDIER